MNKLEIPINRAETFFLQVLHLKDVKPAPYSFEKYDLKEFDPTNPEETEIEKGYFEPDIYDVLLDSYKLPLFRCQNYDDQLLSIQPILYKFEGDILIIGLHAKLLSGDKLFLGNWLRFIEAFRWVHLRKFQESTWDEKYVKLVDPKPKWLTCESNSITGRQIISLAFEGIFAREINLENDALFKNLGRLFVSSYLDLDKEITDEDFYHILYVDRPEGLKGYSDPLPSESKFRDDLKNNTYSRWVHHKEYLGFTSYSFCFTITPNKERAANIKNESFLIYFKTRYHILYLIALLELSIQARFNVELNIVLKESDKDSKNFNYLAEKIADLLRELLTVNSKTWFGQVTLDIQPRELFNLARKVLQTDKLHDQILSKLSQMDEFLDSKTQLSITKRMDSLQKIITPLLILTATLTISQNDSVAKLFNKLNSWLSWPDWLVFILVVGIITFGFSWLLTKVLWRNK